jgi:hypothetical protein
MIPMAATTFCDHVLDLAKVWFVSRQVPKGQYLLLSIGKGRDVTPSFGKSGRTTSSFSN